MDSRYRLGPKLHWLDKKMLKGRQLLIGPTQIIHDKIRIFMVCLEVVLCLYVVFV